MDENTVNPIKGTSLAVKGHKKGFPIGRIFCVGRNYPDHSREMGDNPKVDSPFFFMKPLTSLVRSGLTLPFPKMTTQLEHEIEMAIVIGKYADSITDKQAKSVIFGYATALDLTKRDLQAEAKKMSRPWGLSKGFVHSCPCSAITLVKDIKNDIAESVIKLSVNGQVTQRGTIGDMTWSPPEVISYLSRFEPLMPGDLILTGSPAGVGPIKPGDHLKGTIEQLETLTVQYDGNYDDHEHVEML